MWLAVQKDGYVIVKPNTKKVKKCIVSALASVALALGSLAAAPQSAMAGGNCSWWSDLCRQRITVNHVNQRPSITFRYSGTDVKYYVQRATTAFFLCGNANGANYVYVHSGYNVRVKYFDTSGTYRTTHYKATGWHLLPYTYRSPQCTRKQDSKMTWGVLHDVYEYKQ